MVDRFVLKTHTQEGNLKQGFVLRAKKTVIVLLCSYSLALMLALDVSVFICNTNMTKHDALERFGPREHWLAYPSEGIMQIHL